MVILGLLLLGVGALAIVAGVFTSDTDAAGKASLLGIDLSPMALFLVGVAAGVCVLWGFSILKIGTKREMRARREHKKLSELSEKLDRVEAERRSDDDSN
ncbi:hypothetical protein [Nocardioides sp.]|uniref:hypothetical protein n=1 Tax=Nocardioides sp. TaxID=35761 RepID=UPI003D14DFCA